MLLKDPKPNSRKWIKRGATILFAVEGICFIGTYFIWHRINTERGKGQDVYSFLYIKQLLLEFRKYLNENYPNILEIYYKTGEFINPHTEIRKIDQAYWKHTLNGK